MPSVDDSTPVRAISKIITVDQLGGQLSLTAQIETSQILYNFFEECILHTFWDQNIVDADTSLAAIHPFGPRDSFGSEIEITTGVHNYRALTPKLELARDQILRCTLRDQTTDEGPASKDDSTGFLRSQPLASLRPAHQSLIES